MTPTTPDFQPMAREMIEEDNEYGHSDESLAGLIATALEDAYRTGRKSGIEEAAKVAGTYAPGAAFALRALGREGSKVTK